MYRIIFSSFFHRLILPCHHVSSIPVVSPCPIQESHLVLSGSLVPLSHFSSLVLFGQVASSHSNPVVSSCPKSKPSVEKRGEGSRIQRTFLGVRLVFSPGIHMKNKITKKSSIHRQVSYTLASCNHSSLPGNQCGPPRIAPHEV